MTVTTNDDGVCVELHGKEQFWALRAKVSISKDVITDIQFAPDFQVWRKWEVRMPGTHAPSRLLAGSFWTEEGWDFLYVRRPIGFINPKVQDVLIIETTQDRYKRIILSSNKTEASGIIKWWKKKPAQTKKTKSLVKTKKTAKK